MQRGYLQQHTMVWTFIGLPRVGTLTRTFCPRVNRNAHAGLGVSEFQFVVYKTRLNQIRQLLFVMAPWVEESAAPIVAPELGYSKKLAEGILVV